LVIDGVARDREGRTGARKEDVMFPRQEDGPFVAVPRARTFDPESQGAFGEPAGPPAPRPAHARPTPRLSGLWEEPRRSLARVTVASLRLPDRTVHARALALAERTRALGAEHSLRIWREAYREALVELAREASGVATGVACEALFWEREGDLYRVSATFAASTPAVH
jgi:hypothetical protein